MRTCCQRLRATFFGIVLCSGLSPIAFADWTIDSPPNSLQLVGVDQVASGVLRFTLKNVSDKPIVFLDANAPDGNETGIDAFVRQEEIEPGATGSVLSDINLVKSNASVPMGPQAEAIVKQAQLHALSDLAQKYRVLSEKQVQCIKGYIESLDAN